MAFCGTEKCSKACWRVFRGIIYHSSGMSTTGLEFDLWAFDVECPECHDSIVLPRQSPLGRFDGQADPSKGAWPAEFLCSSCGHGFFSKRERQRPMLTLLAESSLLLRVEYTSDPSNS